MDTQAFASLLRRAAQQIFPEAALDVVVIRGTRLKARLELENDRYVDVFFREETQRVDYALIAGDTRVFGVDNLQGWHYHPVDDPAQHIPCPEPAPEDALQQVRTALGRFGGSH